jgi:MarR family transcriptional regulator, organic hydroperoxide resistance regulator
VAKTESGASAQQLCGLVARLNQRLDTHARQVAERLGITQSQVIALRELSEPMTLTGLASRMCCETSNAGYVVDRMADQGLVERTAHPTDRRAKLISLTTDGRRCRRNVLRALAQDSPTDGLSEAEQRQLARLLTKATR